MPELIRQSCALTVAQDYDMRRAANAVGLGPSEFVRFAVLHATSRALAAHPGARPGLPSVQGRPRKGETKETAWERRQQALQDALEKEAGE